MRIRTKYEELSVGANLGYSVERTADVEDALWVSGNALRNHNTSAALFTDLVDVGAALPNDDRSVLGDDEAAHVDVGRGRSGGSRG